MQPAPAQADAARPFSEMDPALSARPLPERLLLARRLAEQVRALHRSGRMHGAIRFDTLILGADGQPQLGEPPPRRRFGGENDDPQSCPIELAAADAIELPTDIDVAARLLRNSGQSIDPRRIDVYQLGVLLCRVLTGKSIHSYMISPTTKNSVPGLARSILARALGFDAEDRFERCEDLIAALDEAIDRAAASAPADADTRRGARASGAADDTAVNPPTLEAEGTIAPDRQPLPFRRLGHIEILAEIGRGGMGNVYKGYDEELERIVAVKVLPPELARHAELVKRFHAEARAVAAIDHSHVVSVYFTGEESGYHFFAMQYVDGESLARRLDRGAPLALDEALEIAEQTLAGLQAAHDRGLIHRDVKPANILLEKTTTQAVLVDFGLVRVVGDGSPLTAAGTLMGTVDYIAPEQARGEVVDARADLYSVGVVMYRMLAGHLPFSAETPAAVIYQHAHQTARPLCQVNPDLPAEVEAIVGRLLEKDTAARYQTAAEVIEAIRALRGAARCPAAGASPRRPPAPSRPTARPTRSWPAAWVAGLSVAVVLTALVGYLASLAGRAPSSPVNAPPVAGRPGDDAPNAKIAGVGFEPGDALPRNRWVDVLKYVDPSWHTVSGEWRREGAEIEADPWPKSRVVLPFDLEGDYDLAAEFTRTRGTGSVHMIIPVGEQTCQLTLAGWQQSLHGLGKIDGREPEDRDNPASFRPGSLVNERRYRVLLSVRTRKDEAAIEASLDGKPLIAWSGKRGSLSLAPVWGLPSARRAALGVDDATVTFHVASLRSVSGKAKLAPLPQPPFDDAPADRWADLLSAVDLRRDTIHGRWCRLEDGIGVSPAAADEGFVRLMLPDEIEGSYDLVAEFTRVKGSDAVTVTLPVGTRACTLHLSACGGRVAGLEQIGDGTIADPTAPAVRRPGSLVNGRRHKALISVRLLPCPRWDDHDVRIDVWLDTKPLLCWSGRESSLRLADAWELPGRRHVGLGANRCQVNFHTVRVRPIGGDLEPAPIPGKAMPAPAKGHLNRGST